MQILRDKDLVERIKRWNTSTAPFVDFETNGRYAWDPDFKVVCLSITAQMKESNNLDIVQIPLDHQTGQSAEREVVTT